MPAIAVFDTNVLLSGIVWRGRPYLCLELARKGIVEGITCAEILDELSEKLASKLSFTSEQAAAIVADLLSYLRLVAISGTLKAVPSDPDDDKVLDCAVSAGATHIVTGDRRHLLPMGSFQGIQIVSPTDFFSFV